MGLVILVVLILLPKYAAHTQSLDPYTSSNMKIKGVRPTLTDMQGMFNQYPDLTKAAPLTPRSRTPLSDLKYSPDTDWPGGIHLKPWHTCQWMDRTSIRTVLCLCPLLSFCPLFCFSLMYINVYHFNTVKILLQIEKKRIIIIIMNAPRENYPALNLTSFLDPGLWPPPN